MKNLIFLVLLLGAQMGIGQTYLQTLTGADGATGVEVSGNISYVSTPSGIRKYSAAGSYIGNMGSYSNPMNVVFGAATYVATPNGVSQAPLPPGATVHEAYDVVVGDANNYFVSYPATGPSTPSTVGKYDATNGVVFFYNYPMEEPDSYHLTCAQAMCMMADGNIAIVDASVGILIVDQNFDFVSSFAFPDARGIACDGSNLWISTSDCQIHQVDASGGIISSFGSCGSGNYQFSNPEGLFVDGDKLFVADSGNDRVQVYSLNTPLPVKLTNFSARAGVGVVNLYWQTASEVNNKGFAIQRSADGKSYETIGFVNGADKSAALRNYDFVDRRPLMGTAYYRLRQEDFDGQSEFSPIVTMTMQKATAVAVYPNPAAMGSEISLTGVGEEEEVQIFGLTGNLFSITKVVGEKIQIPASLGTGSFFIRLASGKTVKLRLF